MKYNILKKDDNFMESTNLIQLFTDYDLTTNQAKVLATLAQNKTCLTAKQISLQSNIARESIYLILADLKEKGLIQKAITNPNKYCIIPLKSALMLLYQQKTKQIHELAMLTTQVLHDHNKTSKNIQIEVQSQFILIPKNKQFIISMSKAISNSKKNVKIITSWNRYLKAVQIYQKSLKKALSNGVKFQVLITEKLENNQLPPKAKLFYNHPNTSVKFTNSPTKIIEIIIDDQEVFLITIPKADLTESPALWTNNKSLIVALTTCFNTFCDSPEIY